MGLRTAVRFVAVTTDRAGARGVARVNGDQHHPGLRGLVAQKGAKLPKGPTVAHPSLLPSNRGSLADLGQILDGECLTGHARLLDQLLADAVVHIALEPALRAGELPQTPASAARVGLLESLAMRMSASEKPSRWARRMKRSVSSAVASYSR